MFGKVSLVSATAGGDQLVAQLARVSNPSNQGNHETAPRLISYLIRNRHWSPFEMVHMVLEIETTRDIGRQILRHRSFSFQEFSQRYAEVQSDQAEASFKRQMRMKGTTNRQGSLAQRSTFHEQEVLKFAREAFYLYQSLLAAGVAPECARAVLPEGLTPTRMYMSGTLRSWIHYIQERLEAGVQAEHRLLAGYVEAIIKEQFPSVHRALAELHD